MKPLLLLAPLLAPLLLAACSTTPLVTREATTHMTPAEIAAEGLTCRAMKDITSIAPRTICASATNWAAFDRKNAEANEDLFADIRSQPNGFRFR
jgi:hypothetical protein